MKKYDMATKIFQLNEIFKFLPKSRRKAGDGLGAGLYPFFTSSQLQTKRLDEADYPTEALILGTGGAPSIHCADNFSTSADTFIIAPRDKNVLTKYVYYFLSGSRDILDRGFKGAGLRHLSKEYTEKIQIPLPVDKNGDPDLAEQKRVVATLEEAESLKKKRAEADQKMNELIPALFVKMFGDPTNPMGWPEISVGELLGVCEYGTSKKAHEAKIGVPILRMNNVTATGDLHLVDLKYIDLTDKEFEKFKLMAEDVLFNRTNSRELVGKIGMWDGRFPAVAASYFIRIHFIAGKENPSHFVIFMNMPFMKRRLFEMARGAVGQSNINAQELKSIKIPVPPIVLQNQFAEKVKEIEAQKEKQKQSTIQLDVLFSSLLSQVFP